MSVLADIRVDEAIKAFNVTGGRLRISVTPACQLKCIFCHTEGNPDHGTRKFMDPEVFVALLDAFEALCGTEVHVTGGEPLLHPRILGMLDSVGHHRPFRVTLSTNGLALTRLIKAGRLFNIDQFKISMHTLRDDEEAHRLVGKAWHFGRLRSNIQGVRSLGYRVILNYVLTQRNLELLPLVLDEAVALGTDLKVIDLETTSHTPQHATHRGLTYFATDSVTIQEAIELISGRAELVEVVQGVSGSSLLRYREGESLFTVKNPGLGSFETGMCVGCPYKSYCAEGVFALRVNANGTYKPCLLRDDYNTQDAPYTSASSKEGVVNAMSQAIAVMMTGATG